MTVDIVFWRIFSPWCLEVGTKTFTLRLHTPTINRIKKRNMTEAVVVVLEYNLCHVDHKHIALRCTRQSSLGRHDQTKRLSLFCTH